MLEDIRDIIKTRIKTERERERDRKVEREAKTKTMQDRRIMGERGRRVGECVCEV